MTDLDPKDMTEDVRAVGSSGPAEFESLLRRAQTLFEDDDTDGALEILMALQDKYLEATRLFDLMGDVYMRRLDFKTGVRYKTLYEVLVNTLSPGRLARPVCAPAPVSASAPRDEESGPDREVCVPSPPATHFTAAMGHELARQGHFDKALIIFDVLLQKNPTDEALLEAREGARRKGRERRLLGVLERWLKNIEQIKSGRSVRA